jgi:hypothetical protein
VLWRRNPDRRQGGRGRGLPTAREEEEKGKGSDGDTVAPFQSGMIGISGGVRPGDEARPHGTEGGGGHGGTWKRKGGLARAPTQARWRRAAHHVGIGEGVRHGWTVVVSRASCWTMWAGLGKMENLARPKKHNVVFIITQKNSKEYN